MHYNKNTTCQTMCDTPKIVLRSQEMKKFKNKQTQHIQFLKVEKLTEQTQWNKKEGNNEEQEKWNKNL